MSIVVASEIGLPMSSTSSRASSSAFAKINSDNLCNEDFLAPGVIFDQPVSNALRELATAESTSRWPHSETSVSDFAVTGLMSSEVLSVATRAPLITARPSKCRAAAALSQSCLVFIGSPNLKPAD